MNGMKLEEEKCQQEKKSSEEFVGEMIESAKKATKKATAKAEVAAKEAAKKADTMTTEAKKAVAKATKKPLKEEIYLQYAGKEISKDELIKRIKDIWTKELNKKIGDIVTITVYLKPEDNKAYYVINGEYSDSIDL
ncbi:MAG: DUF6465 family protein [Clostridiales bacterium]|nr:DUF6465 family protein [Clostridiales bacterium]